MIHSGYLVNENAARVGPLHAPRKAQEGGGGRSGNVKNDLMVLRNGLIANRHSVFVIGHNGAYGSPLQTGHVVSCLPGHKGVHNLVLGTWGNGAI